MPPRTEPPASAKQLHTAATRDNALALLDDLLNDEKNLSKILIIKSESKELHRLVKEISETAANGAKLLKAMGGKDRVAAPQGLDLPPGESATRAAITKTKSHSLLFSSGAEFEFQLLLTQAQALGYGEHLAKVAAVNEPQPERAREFTSLGVQMKQLYEQVLAMLRKKG